VLMAGSVGQARAMLWPCAAFTLWSGIHYTWRAIPGGAGGLCRRWFCPH